MIDGILLDGPVLNWMTVFRKLSLISELCIFCLKYFVFYFVLSIYYKTLSLDPIQYINSWIFVISSKNWPLFVQTVSKAQNACPLLCFSRHPPEIWILFGFIPLLCPYFFSNLLSKNYLSASINYCRKQSSYFFFFW